MSQGTRILIIDDETAICSIVQLSLRMQANWETIVANKGVEGIALARSHQPDAILLDLMMPEVDGISILKFLKADPSLRSIPVIVLTAKVEFTNSDLFSNLGAQGAMAKPFNPLTLARDIAAILGWSLP